jgi:hypothetical protein
MENHSRQPGDCKRYASKPMDNTDKFIELVGHICRRPKMFTIGGTFGEVVAFFTGLASAPSGCPLSDDGDRVFNAFVTARLLVPGKYWWPYAIKLVAANDEDALVRLRDLLIEFATLRKSNSFREISRKAEESLADYVEPEPAKVWRQFLAARYRSNQHEIEPLILPHADAAVLWRDKPTPSDIAAQLTQISDGYIISVISGSLKSGHVQLATELGIMDAHLVDGSWRIDASSIIEYVAGRNA